MTEAVRIGILGGTFDPIHRGHVDTATAARAVLSLDGVIVLPSRVPPHRADPPIASRYHRFAMTSLAVNGIAELAASDIELCAPGPSYTIDTLIRFRDRTGLAASQIFFITGADAFAEIETWHRFPEVLELAHFVVVSRPGFPVDGLHRALPSLAARMRPAGAGAARSDSPLILLLDARTPDVSSTDIRRRLRAGESIAELVAPAVATHIAQHGLYAGASLVTTADHLHGQD
ncbi:MAG: nicotinate (nicotinamide) nucleotide adenylyltransferase [Acidobacteria bacterium RIFCSPLOWO2_02_FULL_67_36]|nr:MAG: nicotinate (nicotinamide) nucleotide adenylyltransferase [Acidobacteria bacterium RIFCSPLOWO2_02_FULL_67_36]OFW25781.1 MAG: nicotinate (nicotinamide) nucleotide adenylyltransferase [Acidobacteria bacterium RIFCSPLOWO2_12_FULL_66_21]